MTLRGVQTAVEQINIVVDPLTPAARSGFGPFGLQALVSEAGSHGVTVERLLANTGLQHHQLADPSARIGLRQRIRIYGNAVGGDLPPSIGLTAGARQRLTDYAFFGFAMASSASLREALEFAVKHLLLAGPTQQVHYHVEPGAAVLRSSHFEYLDELLPFAAEFWRSSFNTLFELVLRRPVPSRLMTFPYKAPSHWRQYGEQFHCKVEFDADVMEWHLDESALDLACPEANPLTATLCRTICQRMMTPAVRGAGLAQRIRRELVGDAGRLIAADEMAARLKLSERSMFRQLAAENVSYQSILDETHFELAQDLLRDPGLSLDEIGHRLGYGEPAAFRRAFRRWSGTTPSAYRAAQRLLRD